MVGALSASPTFAAEPELTESQAKERDQQEILYLFKHGRPEQALEKANGYLALRPKDAGGLFLKSRILTGLGRPAEAIVVLIQLTQEFPELPEPHNNLAVLYAQQKDYDKARDELEMAVRANPDYALAYENLGDIHAKLASRYYDKAIHLNPPGSLAKLKLGKANELIDLAIRTDLKAGPTIKP